MLFFKAFLFSRATLACALLIACFAWSVPAASLGQSTGLPSGVKNDQNPNDKTISPAESLKRITLPKGFQVELFAAEPDVAQPIAATFDDRGRLWVAECYSHPVWKPEGNDRIVIFEDTDGDGKFDKRKVFWDKGRYLTGLVYGHGGVWICNTPSLMFIPDRDGDDVPDGPPVDLIDGFTRKSPHNVLNNLIWGPDGWLYGSIGCSTSSFIGKPGEPKDERTEISRGIWRYHPIDHRFEVVALGAVNPWGLDFDDWGEGFFTNCVIGHLWHLIPGAYYQRRNNERDNPYAYSRIAPVADHLHWGGGKWNEARSGQGAHSVAGGGHAHTGAMIYLGNNWPDRYRNTFFTGNIHGNRTNNDILKRHGSGYVGHHGQDFFMGNHAWFRCLWQKYGPDGGVYYGDWHETGECHDTDGSHRSSGRIYKVTYGRPKPVGMIDLARLDFPELAKLQLHHNDWQVRHARRLLHEYAVEGKDLSVAHQQLREILLENDEIPRKLRALWSLYVSDGLTQQQLGAHLAHPDEHLRAWSVRLLCDRSVPGVEVIEKFAAMSASDPSPKVRLALAAALQRLPLKNRWEIATGLAAHAEDAQDQNLPHMLWYGIEPLIATDPSRALELLSKVKIPLVRRHFARRLALVNPF